MKLLISENVPVLNKSFCINYLSKSGQEPYHRQIFISVTTVDRNNLKVSSQVSDELLIKSPCVKKDYMNTFVPKCLQRISLVKIIK